MRSRELASSSFSSSAPVERPRRRRRGCRARARWRAAVSRWSPVIITRGCRRAAARDRLARLGARRILMPTRPRNVRSSLDARPRRVDCASSVALREREHAQAVGRRARERASRSRRALGGVERRTSAAAGAHASCSARGATSGAPFTYAIAAPVAARARPSCACGRVERARVRERAAPAASIASRATPRLGRGDEQRASVGSPTIAGARLASTSSSASLQRGGRARSSASAARARAPSARRSPRISPVGRVALAGHAETRARRDDRAAPSSSPTVSVPVLSVQITCALPERLDRGQPAARARAGAPCAARRARARP